MKPIPANIQKPYIDYLNQQEHLSGSITDYLKWLRFYIDFCHKYTFILSSPASLKLFKQKLTDEKQTEQQIRQAKHAISLFYQLIKLRKKKPSQSATIVQHDITQLESGPSGNKDSQIKQSWEYEYQTFKEQIKLRQYSIKTYKSYRNWVREFQAYLKSKSPQDIVSSDAKNYITFLAVEKQVSASTQHQAFHALLFFFRYVLKKEYGDFSNIPRAKKTTYIPTILSRKEIDAIITNLNDPVALLVKLLYGCGLRLTEGLNIRTQDLDFDEEIIRVFGKGRKFRKVPLPRKVVPELQSQLNFVAELHEQDIKQKYSGTFMPSQLEKEYKNSSSELSLHFF